MVWSAEGDYDYDPKANCTSHDYDGNKLEQSGRDCSSLQGVFLYSGLAMLLVVCIVSVSVFCGMFFQCSSGDNKREPENKKNEADVEKGAFVSLE